MRNREVSGINTLAEKEKLAKFLMERLEILKKREKDSGEMLPETRETAVSLCIILDKIRMEGGIVENPDELKNRIFKPWMDKLEGKQESEVSE